MTPYALSLSLKNKPAPIQRACQRKSYLRLYLVVKAAEPFGLCDKRDGHLLAFTDWMEAVKASVPFRGFVTNWDEFTRRKVLAGMTPVPAAMRILHTDKKGVAHSYHAEFDADPEELRTLNQVTPYDAKHTPDAIRAKRSKAKVWEEV